MESEGEDARSNIGDDPESELIALDSQFEAPPRPRIHQGCRHILKSFGVDGCPNLLVSS